MAEAIAGQSVMQAAVNNDIPGIEAECGGEMNCGTCHVYVDAEWVEHLPERDHDEEDMLDVIDEARPNSRLSCQLVFHEDLDGLRVIVPDE
ncbi:2Fe-2S iron-sulfur cluster-binding protein [Streptosporangium sp. NPDC087985]|uniref:2Fe-2S iron-sulfur cluster-binding protein n=1 Tax=Streptosporangium sp. NPDC087985 TaxID=3366196 RepID=UPI0037F7F1E6